MTEDEIRAALDDRLVLALTLWAEARGEPVEGAIAVACVIRNRAQRSSQSIKNVCLAPKQFSCWNRDGSANHLALLAIAEAVLSIDHAAPRVTDAAYRQCLWIADGTIAGTMRDRVKNADHYLTRALYDTAAPAWATGMTVVATVGSHVFLKS